MGYNKKLKKLKNKEKQDKIQNIDLNINDKKTLMIFLKKIKKKMKTFEKKYLFSFLVGVLLGIFILIFQIYQENQKAEINDIILKKKFEKLKDKNFELYSLYFGNDKKIENSAISEYKYMYSLLGDNNNTKNKVFKDLKSVDIIRKYILNNSLFSDLLSLNIAYKYFLKNNFTSSQLYLSYIQPDSKLFPYKQMLMNNISLKKQILEDR